MYSGIYVQSLNITTDEILHSVIKSECLGNSLRQHALLKYLLSEAESGRGSRIKAYSIAIDVLDRGEDFDNNVDSIVRVEMHRLRKNLSLFNATDNTFTLEIPKASYEVIATLKAPITPAAPIGVKAKPDYITMGILAIIAIASSTYAILKPSIHSLDTTIETCAIDRPNLLLSPTTIIGTSRLGEDTALIIDNYLHTGLAQYSMINLAPHDTDCLHSGTPTYTLKTEVFGAADQPFISLIAQNADTGKLVFSEKILLPIDAQTLPQEDSWAFYKITSKLAHASGILPLDAVMQTWAKAPPKNMYLCETQAHKYFIAVTSEEHYRNALICLENEIETGKADPSLYGLLAMLYMEQARGYKEAVLDTPLLEAENVLKTAESIAPLNTDVLLARLRLESERPDLDKERIKHLLYSLERQQPYNPHILVFVAQISGFKLGDWPYAQDISHRTLQIDRTRAYSMHYVEIAHALLSSQTQKAYDISLQLYEPRSTISVIMCLAAAQKAGEMSKISQYKADLATMDLHTADDYAGFITNRNYEPKLTAELIQWTGVSND